MSALWTCPKCKAKFKIRNQWHSCLNYSLDAYFENRPDWQVLVFSEIDQLFASLGEFNIRVLPSVIQFKKKSTFAAIRLQKKAVIIEWVADHEIDDARFSKVVQISTNRFGHVIKIQTIEELDNSIKKYLSKAFFLS